MDEAVQPPASAQGKSVDEVAVARRRGLRAEKMVRRDLSDIVGTWRTDAAGSAALAAQDKVDQTLWT